jgi:hypothetical protein
VASIQRGFAGGAIRRRQHILSLCLLVCIWRRSAQWARHCRRQSPGPHAPIGQAMAPTLGINRDRQSGMLPHDQATPLPPSLPHPLCLLLSDLTLCISVLAPSLTILPHAKRTGACWYMRGDYVCVRACTRAHACLRMRACTRPPVRPHTLVFLSHPHHCLPPAPVPPGPSHPCPLVLLQSSSLRCMHGAIPCSGPVLALLSLCMAIQGIEYT